MTYMYIYARCNYTAECKDRSDETECTRIEVIPNLLILSFIVTFKISII